MPANLNLCQEHSDNIKQRLVTPIAHDKPNIVNLATNPPNSVYNLVPKLATLSYRDQNCIHL